MNTACGCTPRANLRFISYDFTKTAHFTAPVERNLWVNHIFIDAIVQHDWTNLGLREILPFKLLSEYR